MFNLILIFAIFCILSMMVASLFKQMTGLSQWWSAAFISCLGVLLYFINIYLTKLYIGRNAPGVLELDEFYGEPMQNGEYLWEKTAGSGTVPKWVSLIGFASYACFAGTIIWLIIWLM